MFFFSLNQNLKQAACKRRMFKTLTNVLSLDITNKLWFQGAGSLAYQWQENTKLNKQSRTNIY